jgi:hypothetical protein
VTELDYLKLAARAGGLQIDFDKRKGEYFSIVGTPHYWNASLNSQQAFELADALRLMIDITTERVRVTCGPMSHVREIKYGANPRMVVNRWAIVLVAADIQLAKEGGQ